MAYIRTQTFEAIALGGLLAMPRSIRSPTPVPVGRTPLRQPPRMAGGLDAEDEGDTVVKTRPAEPEVKQPPLYKVILLNDDYTPMEFVVIVLMKFFRMDQEKATQFMLAVHTTGSAVVGMFPRDLAETKSEQVNAFAQEHDHPLRSTVEMSDD